MGSKTSKRHARSLSDKQSKLKKIITHQHTENEELREKNDGLVDHIALLNAVIKTHIKKAEEHKNTSVAIYRASRAGFFGRIRFALWFVFFGKLLRG